MSVMPKAIDMTGRHIGRLTFLSFSHKLNSRAHWHVRCDCGTEKTVDAYNVRAGKIESCGCLNTEVINSDKHKQHIASYAGSTRTHGESKTPVYAVWKTMRQRCNNPKNKDYPHYGGKGVKIAPEWDDFMQFKADMGERPEGMTLDRIDPTGNYAPNNCRWATWETQANNKREHNAT